MNFNFPQLPIKNTLLRHLVWAGIVKIALLTAIWALFFRDRQVQVDEASAAAQILAPRNSIPEEPAP